MKGKAAGKKILYDIGSQLSYVCEVGGFGLRKVPIQNKDAERDVSDCYRIGAGKRKGF